MINFILGIFIGILLTLILIITSYILNKKGFNVLTKGIEAINEVTPVKMEVFYPKTVKDKLDDELASNLKIKGQDEVPMEEVEALMEEIDNLDK